MKIQLPKNILVNALEKMHDVSTQALVPDFNLSGRVTIEAKSDNVNFLSSNGCLSASLTLPLDNDSIIETGQCTTDSVKLRNSVRRLITQTQTSIIELSDTGGMVMARDIETKKKRNVKIPRDEQNHKPVIEKPDEIGLIFETDRFLKAIKTISPFQSNAGYKIEYQVLLFHNLKNEIRFVCGDGTIFAIFTIPKHSKDKVKREFRKTIPVNQLHIISSLVADSTEMEILWKDGSVWVNANNGTNLSLCGLPKINYVAYDNHAYLFDEAKAYTDIKVSDLTEVANLIGTLRDKDNEEQGRPHSCVFTGSENLDDVKFEITQEQSKFQCEYEIPAVYHNLNSTSSFESRFAHLFLDNMVHSARHPYLRFYLIEEVGVANARDVDLGENDDRGIPRIKDEPDNCVLTFFFAALGKHYDEIEEGS